MYTIFCRFCGAGGAVRFGRDACGRQRFRCPACTRTFTRRTNTVKSGSHLSDRSWNTARDLFITRTGMSGVDLGNILGCDRKTGQKLNRVFRSLVLPLIPGRLPGVSEWDEACPLKEQWVVGGASRENGHCSLHCVSNRSEDILTALVERHTDPEGMVFTDEWGGYCGLLNHMTVCHERGFTNPMARFVHTNRIEGVWGHLKPLGKHVYRGFPRSHLPQYLAEFMFRYNHRSYDTRKAVLSALLSRPKINTLRV